MEPKTIRRLVGELLVVVFGILIAFGVDRWNQDRQDRVTAGHYVEALAEDLAADTASLSALTALFRGREEAARRVLDVIERNSPFQGDPAALARDINYSGWVTSFESNDLTYRELVSTGGLGLIKSPDLKRAIVAYYQNVEFLAQFYPQWQETALAYYRPEVRSRVTPTAWIAIETSGRPEEGKPFAPDPTLDALRRDGLIQKLLASMMTSLEQQAVAYESLRADAIELLGLLPTRSR